MPRRMIVTKKQIYARRGEAWSSHYRNRETAKTMISAGWNGTQIVSSLNASWSTPEMEIDGRTLDIPLNIRQEWGSRLQNIHQINDRDLLCIWYWTADNWQDFVRQFQSLPDVYEDYYYLYEPEPIDRMRLIPMSSKPKQGSEKKVQVPISLYVSSG